RVRRQRVPMRWCRSQKPAKSAASAISVAAGCHPACESQRHRAVFCSAWSRSLSLPRNQLLQRVCLGPADGFVDGPLEPLECLKHHWIGEGQDLGHENAGDLRLRIEPEISVVETGPGEAAGATRARQGFAVDEETQAPFLCNAGHKVDRSR